VAERWCYPIPIAMQRHTGSHLSEVVPLQPDAKAPRSKPDSSDSKADLQKTAADRKQD
jgi:hypothetical protein